MKTAIFNSFIVLAFTFIAVSAKAQEYKCHAKANPNRGFEDAFDLEMKGSKVGSEIVLNTSGITKKVGTVTEVNTLNVNDPVTGPAFEGVHRYLIDEDVSGVPEKVSKQISSIQAFRDGSSDAEITVYRIFVRDQQVGGSLVIDGHGTACF